MSFEKEMYEVKEKWEEAYFIDQDHKRIAHIYDLIPKDAKTLLDVGCGNGILVNYLSKNYHDQFDRICAVDRSKTSLQFVRTEKYEASIDQLPFQDKEFDIALCLEVIEHLPLKVFEKALMEIERVAKKYVIISVPYRENLDFSKVSCPKCKTEFSPFYHMHSFDEEKLSKLFENSSLTFIDSFKLETSQRPYWGMTKKWISRKINPNSFPANCICPMCGYNEFHKLKSQPSSGNQVGTTSPKKGLSRFWPHKSMAKWIAAIYKK